MSFPIHSIIQLLIGINEYISLCLLRAEGDGEQLVGGEEEFCLSDS